jgi:hypothetical protein
MTCRGWRQVHQVDELVVVEVAYEGAWKFPSEYRMCRDCAREMGQFVSELRAKHGRGAVRWIVDGVPS